MRFFCEELESAKQQRPSKVMEIQTDPCSRCGLSKGVDSPKMEMHGQGRTGIFLVGQSPGKEEDKLGRQFVQEGRSGDVLRDTTARVGFDFDRDFYVQNAFRCHPEMKKQSWQIEVKACHSLLMEDVRSKKPWLVVALGKEATQAAIHDFGSLTVAKYQSLLIPMVEEDYWVYCTNHPAALLHGGKGQSKYEWIFGEDWKEIARIEAERDLVSASMMKKEWDLDNYKILMDFDGALSELQKLYHHDFFRDYENYPLKPYDNDSEVICFSFAYQEDDGIKVFSVPWKQKYWTSPQRRRLLYTYRKALENPDTMKAAHHHKHELQWDDFLGIKTRGRLECTAIRQHLIREPKGTAGLKFQVFVRWGCRYDDLEKYKEDMREAPEPEIYVYNCHDSRFGLKLWLEQEEEKYPGFDGAYDLFLDGDCTLTRMEITGVNVDQEVAREIGGQFEGDNVGLEKWLLSHDWAHQWVKSKNGQPLNLNSGQQVGELLFEILKLPGGIRGKAQWETNKGALAKLSKEHEWIEKWQEAGRFGRFKGTFVDGHIFDNLYDDGLLHGTCSLTIPESYRSSMSNPNLQNMVKRDEVGKRLRKAFIPLKAGWEIGSFDYKQHEIVTYCHNTEDQVMIDAILSDHDLHQEYAARLLGRKESSINDRERDEVGKTGFVFPVLYGAYPKIIYEGLQENGYLIPYNHIVRVWQQFRRQFSKTVEWQENLLKFYRNYGYVESKLGFRRRAPLTANEIINFPGQSMAFHYLLYGLHKADEKMLKEGLQVRPVKQIHDEAEFHYPVEERERVFEIVKESFENLPWNWAQIPSVKIEGKVGPNWYDLRKVKL